MITIVEVAVTVTLVVPKVRAKNMKEKTAKFILKNFKIIILNKINARLQNNLIK